MRLELITIKYICYIYVFPDFYDFNFNSYAVLSIKKYMKEDKFWHISTFRGIKRISHKSKKYIYLNLLPLFFPIEIFGEQ